MRYAFIQPRYPLTVLCHVLEVSRSGYDAFQKKPPTGAEPDGAGQVRRLHLASRQTDRQRRLGLHRIHRPHRETVPDILLEDIFHTLGKYLASSCRNEDTDNPRPPAATCSVQRQKKVADTFFLPISA